MTDKDILISDLNDICEILINNGYGGWYATILEAVALLKYQESVVRCKDCKYYKIEECWEDMGHGVKMKAGRYEAICTKWANGTDSDGYCFRAELLD